jgi:Flp pilus assembly protein TadG
MRLTVPRRRAPRRGASAVEFCIILPLLVLLVLACVDFGRFAYSFIAVNNAARAGAEYGVMNPYIASDGSSSSAWLAAVEQAARDEMAGQTGYSSTDLSTVISSAPEAGGFRYVRVEARYPFRPLVRWPGVPGTFTMKRAVRMRSIR